MSGRFGLVLIAAMAAVLGVALGLGTGPAAAQTGDARDDLSFTVARLTGTLSPGGELAVRARVANDGGDAEGLRLVGTLHSSVPSRLGFQMAVDDGRLGAVLDGFSAEIDALDAGQSTVVELSRSAAQLGFRRADQFGVYPLRLQLLEQGDVVHEVRTAVIFTAEQVERPVRSTLLVPVSTPPLLDADGTYPRDRLISELGSAGRTRGLIGSLAAREGFAATLAPDPLLLAEATDLADGFRLSDGGPEAAEVGREHHLATQARGLLQRVREVADRPEVDVLAMPYGRADLGALVDGDMVAEAERHLVEARRRLEEFAGSALISGALWPPDAVDTGVLAVLTGRGVDTLVLSEQHLDIPEGRALSPSPVRTLGRVRGRAPTVLVPDPWLEDVLDRNSAPDGVPLTVQRILAETAAVYFERPFAQDVRGLLLAPPQSWSPRRGLAGALMDALDAAPWLEPVTLSRLARTVEPETAPVRLDPDEAARTRQLSTAYIAELDEARRALGSLAQVLAVNDGTPSRFDRLLLAAASVSLRTEPAEGRAMIAAVSNAATGLYSAISIEEGPQVWMDSEGPVPVTVANAAEVPLRVRVELQSQRFRFGGEPIGQPPDDLGGWVIPAGDTRTLTFQAAAVTTGGRAPVSVVVRDVHGGLVLAQETLVIRSTAVSVPALVITSAAGLFLLVWLVGQVARRRRRPERDQATQPSRRSPAQAGSPERR